MENLFEFMKSISSLKLSKRNIQPTLFFVNWKMKSKNLFEISFRNRSFENLSVNFTRIYRKIVFIYYFIMKLSTCILKGNYKECDGIQKCLLENLITYSYINSCSQTPILSLVILRSTFFFNVEFIKLPHFMTHFVKLLKPIFL